MSKEKLSIKELLDWCNAQVAEGKEIVIKWEGGGDSGWVYFEIDGEQANTPETDQLVDMIYDELDYGSWAGEFSASGEAIYDPEKQLFTGTDYYSETERTVCNAEIEVRIPKWLPFSDINIHTEEDRDNEMKVSVDIFITNGFQHPETHVVVEELEDELAPEFSTAIHNSATENNEDFDSTWEEYHLTFSEFKEDGDDMVAVINDIGYAFATTEERTIEIDFQDLLETQEEA